MGNHAISWFRFAIVVLATISRSFGQSVETQVGTFVSDQLLNNVVSIRATVDGTSRIGAGLIFGRSGETLWVATAAHVVSSSSGTPSPPGAAYLEVKLKGDSRVWPISSPPELAFGFDLAFIGIRVPITVGGADMWRNNVEVDTVAPGTAVRIAARPGEIVYGEAGATVAKTSALTFDALRGQEGQSGAPLATAKGFLGIYTKSAGDRIILIRDIRLAASKAGRPWQLTAAPRDPVSAVVCLKIDGELSRPPNLNGPSGIVAPDSQNCYSTLSGQTKVVAIEAWIACEPESFDVAPGRRQEISISCRANPIGIWVSPNHGFLSVSGAGSRIWKISGLQGSPFGGISGILTGTPPLLFFQGTGSFNQPATGQINLTAREMSGTLLIGGATYPLRVTR